MADKDNKSKLTYHVWDKDNNEYDIPDEVVQQRGMDNFAKDFEGGYITMFDDKKQKVDVPIEDVGEYRKQGYMWYDTSGNATPINEVGKKPSPSKEKEQSQYPQEVIDAFNSPDNKPGNFKDLAQLNDEYQRGELKKPGIISQALGMMPKVDAGNIGREQKMGGMIANMLLGDNMQQPQQTQQPQDNNQQVQQPAQQEASPESKEESPVTTPSGVVNNEGLMDAKLANYLENWKQRPDKQGTYFENMVADLLADGTANSNEEAVNMVQSALGRYANRSAMDVTNQVVASLPDDTVQDAEQSIEAQWYSHGVQDKLKHEADSMGISYDDYVGQFLKPAMVQSLVNKYGPNYRDIAEGIATRLYSHDEHVQDRLMNQDINEALSDVINKYVNPSIVEEYNKAQEAGSKAFTEGMEGSQFIPANLRLGTALGAQYEANEAKDPAKVLSSLQKKFGKLYRNPQFLNDMSNAAFKVMQRYGLNGGMSGDPKQFKPMINSVLKNELDQLEIKGMMPKGSAEYIMKTGLGNTIVGKITRKAVQTDYQNWLEDIANQQYQPGFWENVASGALTFAGDAWSYWLPGAAGGKLTKSMIAKAEGKLAGDLMAKGMERKVAERAAKVLIGKSKDVALKNGAVHGAVTFGGQSAISKPIDEVYRTGQFDENGKIYNPSVGKVIANTLGEVAKQSAVGAIMQGGTIANMIGKGRGLATNILADVGGKVVDSGIMTGQQLLERMAHDPNFKPTGKDAAETFLESGANLLSIGFPGFVGKYARFKDAREFNKKYDFTDQDIAELKRFGYDDLRDAFEKLGINGYRADGEGVQMMGQLTDKYMNLMNDKGVPEVLKAKMMAVVEGKRPSSFSPVIDSIIVQPMDNDGKVYLETLNKDGGIIDRKGYSSLEEAQKAEKKLDFEKSLNITSEYEKAYHTDALQDRLNTVYEQARDKYAAGEQLSDEDKAAIYLHQNASAIGDIMQKQQSGMELTEQEQQMVNSYRHFYDSAFENSPIMKEYVRTFEDSQGVEHGTLRKALEGDGKSRTAEQQKLVEEYQKQLYNDIVLKREMNDAKEQMSQTLIEGQRELPGATQEGGASAQNAEATAEKPVDASVSSDVPPTEPPTPPVGGETPINAEGTPSVENGSSPSDATTASNESKSDAYIMGQNAYQKGDAEGLKAIDHNDDVSKARLKRAFGGDEAQMNVVVKAYEDGKDMEQFVAQRANSLTPAQQDAVHKYVEAQDAKNGVYDALQHADDGYGEALKEQLWPYQTEDGNIVPATLTTGQQVFLKKANEYGGGFVVVPGEDGNPTIKQVSSADIKEVGTPVPMDDYINQQFADQKNARQQQFFAQYDGSGLKPSDTVEVAMESGDEPMQMTFAGYSEDGKIVLSDGKDNIALSKDEFNAWRQNAIDTSIGAELDAEDAQRANDDAAKAEAEKKQRYNDGIVGLGMGQPDYSSKDTDAKVAAEYLQEQYGEDHGKLLNLVNGSRDDIKTQLANKKKAAAEYQNWLDTNADLDPEKAQKVENDLALVNEQIANLDARFKNWNTIRNSVMTPDEVKAMKEERKAEVEKAGVDETAIVPSDDFHLLVLDDKELKKQYPTMDEANGYITSQRKDIYHTQEDVEHKMNDVNDMLEQYINGETELDPTQLMELNTTKAQLEALQTNLSVAAKGLKAQANKLSKLYKTEVSQQEMEELGMTPSEQRKTLVADALKKNDLGAIKEIYKDASVDVTDLTPQTLEEAVSESLRPHSLNPESLQYELGKSNFKFGIGKGYDSNKFNYLIAKKGTGMSVNDFAVKVYNDLPVNLQDMGYTDQDVRNALLDMFKSYDSVKEMRNVALMNRIAAAEDELSSEEEYYEAQKEREIIERQAEIENYKSYINEKELSLPSESELDHINGLEFDRMMEIEDRDREYKQYVKSILPELADYDDRSNEEGYGGGSSLGSDSSRRGVDEGNSQGEEVGNGEASSESEIGEGSDSGRKGRQETGSMEPGEGSAVRGSHLPQEASFGERLKSAIAETETEPTEAQKKAGNYKKGHLSFGGYDYTVETPKGVTRSGKDEQGKPWSVTMHDTYGYILGKIGVDGDHIDMFINDAADLDSFDGNVYVVDQVNPETGEFDEHKVMFGYPSEEAATEAYLANYSKGWKGLGKVTAVPKATFDKWLESSDRKTKPFADYAMIKKGAHQDFFSNIPEEKAKEKLQNVLQEMTDGKFPSEIDWNRVDSIYHSYYHRFGDVDADAAKYRKDVQTIWNKAYNNHLQEISKNKAESYVSSLNPFSLKEKIQMWKTADDVDSYVDHNVAYTISNGRSLKDDYLYDEHHSDFYVSLIEKFAHILAEKNYFLDAALQKQAKEKVPMREKILRDALIDVIKDSGIEVVTDNKEGQKVLDSIRNVITVYHGAGASFDHFNHFFMGSGEGAQAFGWGTYLTEVPGIANEYSKASSERKLVSLQKLYFKNEEVDSASYTPWMIAHNTLEKYGKDFDKAFKVLEEKHQQYIKDNVSILVGNPDENRHSAYSAAIEVLKEEQKNPGSLVFEPAVFDERERNLYVVEIPKDDGDNYLNWDSSMSNVKYEKLSKLLSDKGIKVPTNKQGSTLYNQLAESLNSQKEASLMLSSLGFVGIKYPANYRSGGRKDGALNYVIFQEADAKIYEDYKFFRSSDGTVYGFVHDGKIYIDPSIATSEVPIHEYTHIWSGKLRSANPKEWDNIISLMKGTTIWNEVKNSNENLKTDSDIADEVLALYSGRRGSQRIEAEFENVIKEDSSLLDKAKAMNAIHKVKQAINKFWKAVTDFFHVHFGSADEVADTVLRDFLNEVNPLKQESVKEEVKPDNNLPFAQMNMDDLPFHRDVKEVKPSEMTEAQKVAYDAVSTMLKKAGIPVKVVSNEDMEKVAEAQDNLNLAMLLNQPEMRFKIKTPEEKQAAENAYNFAKELRPDKWKQYAVVDMSNPNKMPEYFEKQELARKERSYYNKLMWGNYKVFNLDKSFEDNVAGLTGSFPSEFDPYKIDAQTSKKNELKKQIKETEEAYKLTGQERKEYQNQLMKEYMDEHGLASENDIPDDVWREFDYKAVEKYQDKLDSLFAKYKDFDRQLKAVAEPGVQYLKGKGVVYGYTDGKEIVLNQEQLNANTPIHEYQHLWRTAAKKMNPELIEHGDKLIMQTQLFADLKEDPNYKHLSDDEICDEAFARLTGEDGAAILEQMAKDAIKENPLDTAKELSVINKLKEWLKKFWYWTLDTFTKWKPEDIKKMSLEDIRNLVLRDLANGVDPRTVLNEKKAKNAEDADKTLVGVHNISEDKLLKAIKQGGLANPSVAVIDSSKQDHKAYGGISLILPSDKIAKRTGKNAGTWQGDAYTPTYPEVEKQMSNKGAEKSSSDVLSVPKEMQHEVRNGIDRWLNGGDANSGLKYLFLHEKGNAPKMVELQHKYSDKVYNDLKSITSGNFDISSIGKDDAQKVLDMYIDNVFGGDRAAYEEKQKYRITRYKKQVDEGEKNPFLLARAKNALEQYDKYGFYFDKVQEFVRKVERDHRMTGVDTNATLNDVEDYIKTNNLTDEFNTWLEGKEKEYGIKEVIFDGFTPSGNRRYVPNTLENVSKLMKKQGRNGATGAAVSFQNFAARLMPSYGTLKDIRSKKGLLTSDREKFDKFRDKWSSVFFELGNKCQPDSTSAFDSYGMERLSEAAMTSDPQAYLKKEYNVNFSDEDTKRLKEMVKAIKEEHPAMYFETKFERPVSFDEFSAAVVPTTTKKEVKEALKNAGVSIFEYDEKNDADRKRAFNEAINSNHDIRFHRVTEPEELERLNKEKTFRMYSGMQEVDGKLYSPMAAIIDGKRTDDTEIGAWMGADERPDLVKGGKFQLVKTDKNPGAGEGPVRAAYNPYMHTSTSMMNDQFTGAYARGNIKVVEWEIPESEKTSGYHAEGAKDAVGLVPWHSGSVNGLLPKDRQRSVMLSRWRKAVRVVPDSEVAESIAEQLEGTGLAIPWNVVTPNQLRELVKLGVPITTEESGQQAPETKEKFLAQMEELKKEFPQAQFVNVKMTKDAFKEWGVKNNVKLSLGDTVPFVREQRSINNAFNDALDKQIAGTLPKGYNYQLGKPSSALKFAGIEDLPIELSSRTLEVKSSKDYKSNHPFDLNSVKNLPVAIQRPVAIFDSEYEDGRKVILTELKDGKGHSIIAVLGLRKLRGRNYAEVNSIISLYGKDSSVRIANWFDSKNPNGLGLDKNLCRWADTKKASEWLTNNASNVHSVGLSLKRIAKVINSFENNQFSEENLLLKHNFGDILGNSEGIAIENMRKVADSVVNTANKLGGAEATVYSSLDDVPEEYRSEVEQGAKGWYDPETHTVHVYLPNCADANEAERTVLHEKIGHEGMEVLLGGENEVRKFANFVYRSASKDVRGKIIDFANKYDPDWKNNDRMNVGTQEYIAHLAEEGPKTAEDFSLWTKIKHYLIKVLKTLGVRVPGLLNDKDLRYYLMKAGKALHVWDEMPREKQEALMKQASNAEIKDALSDGAGKGKPRQKKGESYIQYMKRAQEWRKWQNAREDKENPEPPMFYDIDKDEAGKKEWAQLNKDWRERHHLVGEEPTGMPIRMEGEEDDAYKNRKHEYEKWQAAMKDQEDPLPDMFAFEKEKEEEVKRKYEDWLAKHDLLEQQQADLDLYEGKIYPAETNPEADALEQQVMQDLAEVTSTDVSKEGAARSVHDAVIYRRKNIESASATDAIFINSVKQELNKMANASYLGRKADAIADVVKETVTGKTPKTQAKRMAEAIPYIIEAPRRMRDIANELNAVGAFENGHIHVTAEDVDAIQPFTEELRDLAANSHKVEKNGKETIVYDDVPSMTEVASKMAKAINENHKGEEGFVPIDGTDFLAEHVLPVVLKRIVPKGIEYKNLSEEMQSLLGKIREWYDKTFTWLKDSHTVRNDIGYTADYVNHRWDKEKSDDKAYADLVEGRQRTKSPNEKPRKVSTYMEGVDAGLVPKTTDITDLLAYYSQSNIEAFANKTFLQELSGINVIERNKDGEIISSMPLLSSIQPKEMMVDENKYTPYVVPGINTVWVYNQGKIFNKSAEDWFNAAFGTVKIPKVLKGVKNAMSIAKTLELGFSGFHAGALTEVYAVQNSAEFGPAKAMAYFMKYLITDTAKTHQLPAFANPEAFKEAAKHLVKFGSTSDYATADIENLYEKVHSYVAKLHSKLVDGNVAMKAGSSVTFPLEVATELLKMSQKGLDVALWSYLHDGLKLATYQLRAERTMERAKKLNWDEDMLNKALDEDGQFVNDMFGGQHFDVLGISKKMQTILDFIFLSKDWLISTTRHALSIFGYGSIWNEASIKNFWEYYKHVLGRGEMTKEDYLRLSRSKSGLLCYGVGFMIGYEGLSQLVNAAMRAWDEEKQKEKADEIRKTNPSYKSPYELAYPDGMHWYDYLMRGNSLGQQSKIFMGRYADGTEMYIRHGKQFREIPELFFDAKDNFAFPGPMVRRMYGKASPLLRSILDANDWFKSPDYADKEMQRKYGENLGLIPKLASYYVPFAVPTQKDKEFKMLDLVFPSSKGFSRYKAQDYFKTFIMSEDKQGLAMTYNACVQNGIDPEEQLKAAISSVKALEASEMQDGVTSLQVASERFDEAKSITEKKKMRQKMKKFLSQSDYKAFTQKEALDMVQSYLNGEDDLKEMEKAESKYLMKAKAEDVTEDWRIQNVWNGTIETYQEYQRLKYVDKAKANAFKNSKTNKRLFAARKAISAAKKKMNKSKKQMDGQNDAAKLVEIRKTRKELLETLNGME
nr:MAG TPA: nuclease [Caudoviricetes sp.]